MLCIGFVFGFSRKEGNYAKFRKIHITKSSAFYFSYEPYENAEQKAPCYPVINHRITNRSKTHCYEYRGLGGEPLKLRSRSGRISFDLLGCAWICFDFLEFARISLDFPGVVLIPM